MKILRREKRAKVKSAMQTGREFLGANKSFFREDSFLDRFMITIS